MAVLCEDNSQVSVVRVDCSVDTMIIHKYSPQRTADSGLLKN